jgi:hypothetical protein
MLTPRLRYCMHMRLALPQRILSTKLGVKQMYAVNVEKQADGSRECTTEIKDSLRGKTVLLVEVRTFAIVTIRCYVYSVACFSA